MMQWVSQVDYTPLEEGDASFHPLALRWMQMVESQAADETLSDDQWADAQWTMVTRFFGQLDSSAEEYWHVPRFDFGESYSRGELDDGDALLDEEYENESADEDELDNLFSAAYEEVTYRDSTDDGLDSSIYDPGEIETDYELEDESYRIRQRLDFLRTVARLWKSTATAWDSCDTPNRREQPDRRKQFDAWHREAVTRYTQLVQLLEEVHQHRVPVPSGSHESMVEFDRRRMMLESLTEKIITTCVEMSDAGRLLRAAAGATLPLAEGAPASDIHRTIEILRAILIGDAASVSQHWPAFVESLVKQEILYVPLSRGGSPRAIVKARALHGLIHDLLGWLPRLGLVKETCQLLDVAQQMEANHPVGQGAITEYDRLFENGYQALVRCVVTSADSWGDDQSSQNSGSRQTDNMLIEALQDLTESQLERWLHHSMTVRLSVVERLAAPADWQLFMEFSKRYGPDLFTQRFLNIGNLRAILHQGVNVWLSNQEIDPPDEPLRLLEEIGTQIPREAAVEMLTLAIEAVVENYREYRDYNSTTTQSDHGELLYMFIDFLRLRASYDRWEWRIKPVFMAHNILIRQGRGDAAEMWRQAIVARTAATADQYQKSLTTLSQQYGMRLPSITERLGERFTRSLTVDRLRALVAPAIEAVEEDVENPPFELLKEEIGSLIDEPCGAGLDVPDWIAALEDEVTLLRRSRRHHAPEQSLLGRIKQVPVKWETLQDQIRNESPQGKPE